MRYLRFIIVRNDDNRNTEYIFIHIASLNAQKIWGTPLIQTFTGTIKLLSVCRKEKKQIDRFAFLWRLFLFFQNTIQNDTISIFRYFYEFLKSWV